MTIYSYLHEIYQNYDSKKKGRLLSKAIKKANQCDSPLVNNDYWANVALQLLNDPAVPTHYVPIRDVINSLEKGNIAIAMKLYLNPDDREVHNRADELINELLDIARGNKQALAQIDEVNHLLDTIAFMAAVVDLKGYGYSINDMKIFILEDLAEQTRLDTILHPIIVEQTLNFILSQKLDTKENIIQTLPHFKKLVPTRRLGALHEMIVRKKLDDQTLRSYFPRDIIKSKDGQINIALTLGLDEDLFAELQNQDMSATSADYDQTLGLSSVVNKTMYHLYDSIKNFKTIRDSSKNLVGKVPSIKTVSFGLSSVKNLKDSQNIDVHPVRSFSSDKILTVDLKQIQKYSKDGSMSNLHGKSSDTLYKSSLELHDTRSLASSQIGGFSTQSKWYDTGIFSQSLKTTVKPFTATSSQEMKLTQTSERPGTAQCYEKQFKDTDSKKYKWPESDTSASKTAEFDKTDSTRKWYETAVLKGDKSTFDETSKQSHAKKIGLPNKWFKEGFFTKSSKTAVTYDNDQLKSTKKTPSSFHRRGGETMDKTYDIEETNRYDMSITKLYGTYNQSHSSAQSGDFDETGRSTLLDSQNSRTNVLTLDKEGEGNFNRANKDLDTTETFIKDVDDAFGTHVSQSATDDFSNYDATITITGDTTR